MLVLKLFNMIGPETVKKIPCWDDSCVLSICPGPTIVGGGPPISKNFLYTSSCRVVWWVAPSFWIWEGVYAILPFSWIELLWLQFSSILWIPSTQWSMYCSCQEWLPWSPVWWPVVQYVLGYLVFCNDFFAAHRPHIHLRCKMDMRIYIVCFSRT